MSGAGPATAVVTAAMVRDAVLCERRVERDLLAAPAALAKDVVRDRLWAGRIASLDLVVPHLAGTVADLRMVPDELRMRRTTRELVGGADHVVGGTIEAAGLRANVDVLSRVEGRWTAGAARAAPLLGRDGVGVRAVHGVEIGVAARILGATGAGDGERAFLVDAAGGRVSVDLREPWGGATLEAATAQVVARVRGIAKGDLETRGETHPRCRLCPHRAACLAEMVEADDLTLVRGISRDLRGAIAWVAPTRRALAAADLDEAVAVGLPGGLDRPTLELLQGRAALQLAGGPAHARAPLGLRAAGRELHLSIAHDPTLEVVWGIGVLERDRAGGPVRHRFLMADGVGGERRAFAEAWRLMTDRPGTHVRLRSAHQAQHLRVPQASCPGVCDHAALEALLGGPWTADLGSLLELVEWPGLHPGVLEFARWSGFDIDDDDVSGVTLVRLGADWSAVPSEENRAALEAHDLRMCRASAAAAGAMAALPVRSWADGESAAGVVDGSDGDGRAAAAGSRGDAAAGLEVRRSCEPAPRPRALRLDGARTAPDARPPAAEAQAPAMRVCPTEIRPSETAPELACYRVLSGDMPLGGEGAFARGPDGGFVLVAKLRERAPWMEAAVGAIDRSLRIDWWRGRAWLSWLPILLVGEPGCGKSRFARDVATLAGVRASSVDLAAASDALNLVGVARGWSSAIPSWTARAMVEQGVANPVLVANELDKAGGHRGSGGRVHDALLGMLEPGTAAAFNDRCLLVDLDLSAVCWVFTANSVAGLPGPLLSRLDVVEVGTPGPEHFDALLARMRGEVSVEWGVPPAMMPLLPRFAVDRLRRLFERHRSARRLAADVRRLLSTLVPDLPDVLH